VSTLGIPFSSLLMAHLSPFTPECLTKCYTMEIRTPPEQLAKRGTIKVSSLSSCLASSGYMNQVILTPRNHSVTGEKAKQLKGSMVDKEGVRLDFPHFVPHTLQIRMKSANIHYLGRLGRRGQRNRQGRLDR
jgi:hypothetical protein